MKVGFATLFSILGSRTVHRKYSLTSLTRTNTSTQKSLSKTGRDLTRSSQEVNLKWSGAMWPGSGSEICQDRHRCDQVLTNVWSKCYASIRVCVFPMWFQRATNKLQQPSMTTYLKSIYPWLVLLWVHPESRSEICVLVGILLQAVFTLSRIFRWSCNESMLCTALSIWTASNFPGLVPVWRFWLCVQSIKTCECIAVW